VHCFEAAVLVLVLLQRAPLWVFSLFASALASVIPNSNDVGAGDASGGATVFVGGRCGCTIAGSNG
jgi:hypothetical protein